MPAPEGEEECARQEERITMLRHLAETLDLLYDVFCRMRTGAGWPRELPKLKKWLHSHERERALAVD